MRAILTYTSIVGEERVEKTRLFDTEKAKKICDVENTFGYKVQEIYITQKGIIFLHSINSKKLEVADQKKIKQWIGEHEPDKYIEFFGEVEEG